jgi:hypothetical protein
VPLGFQLENSWGFLVHEGGIEVGKKSMKAIDEVVPPTNLKEFHHCLARSILSGDSFQICHKR